MTSKPCAVFQYEQELSGLRQQLAATQAMLADAQAKLMGQDAACGINRDHASDENLEKIIDRLVFVAI